MNQCLPRSRDALIAAVAAVDPLKPDYVKHDVTGDGKAETFCNKFVADVTALLDCPVPQLLANDQIHWLEGLGASGGWRQVFPTSAFALANKGAPVVATYLNPGGHGHIAIVVPTPENEVGIYVAQAGSTNFACGPVGDGFGRLPVRYFAHH